jgi:hypothetical protein
MSWREHLIDGDGTPEVIASNKGARMAGFNVVYADISGPGRRDIIGAGNGWVANGQIWIEQPAHQGDAWNAHLGYEAEGDSDAAFIGTLGTNSLRRELVRAQTSIVWRQSRWRQTMLVWQDLKRFKHVELLLKFLHSPRTR